jgi:hypothetical protein
MMRSAVTRAVSKTATNPTRRDVLNRASVERDCNTDEPAQFLIVGPGFVLFKCNEDISIKAFMPTRP